MHDYRKTLALIAPGILSADAEVWLSESTFDRLRKTLEEVMVLDVQFELQRAIETQQGLDLHYRAFGIGRAKMKADRLMLALYNI